MTFSTGTTFRKTGLYSNTANHLHVIISDTNADPVQLVHVNFTSWNSQKLQACVVDPSAHPYLQHRSCIAFEMIETISVHNLRLALSKNLIECHDPASPELLATIRARLPFAERVIPGDISQMLKDQGVWPGEIAAES